MLSLCKLAKHPDTDPGKLVLPAVDPQVFMRNESTLRHVIGLAIGNNLDVNHIARFLSAITKDAEPNPDIMLLTPKEKLSHYNNMGMSETFFRGVEWSPWA